MKSTCHSLFHLVLATTWIASAAAQLDGADANFRRGDGNVDGKLDLTDAVFVLQHLFTGGQSPPCLDAADANDDGALNLTDPVQVLSHLFQGAGPLAAPFEACGSDPTGASLGCASYLACAPAAEVKEAWIALLEVPKSLDAVERMAVDLAGGLHVQTGTLTVKYDTEGKEVWRSPYPGGEGRAEDLAIDDAGNVHVTGFYTDPRANIYKFTTVKYAPDGKELWVVRDGPSGVPSDLAVDSAGNSYVTGTRFVTVKYDAGGNELWKAQYKSSDTLVDSSTFLAVDSDGNVHVTGISETDEFGPGYDGATVKYDSKGNQLWVARYDGTDGRDRDGVSGLAVDGVGNVYVAGVSLPSPPTPSFNRIVKYGADGSELWVARRDGLESIDMAVDCAGNLYLTGATQKTASTTSATTVKYDTDGRELWVDYYDPRRFNDSNSLVLDSAGSVYVTGISSDGDVTSSDIVTMKYDSDGNRLWVASRPAPECSMVYQRAANLAIDRTGNVYAWGGLCGFTPGNTLQTVKYVQSAAPAQEP